MSTVRRWDALTREEIGDLAATALLVLPVGSTEQHGPHLATGTDALLAQAIAVAEASRELDLVAATAMASDLVDPADIEGPLHGHAGSFETSLLLALDPDRVRPELARPSPGGAARKRPRGLVIGEPGRWKELDGFTDRPDEASRERGEQALAACVAAVAGAIEQLADTGA
jgi:creatinine amidohydrolase/Fe(II)-dependent formamide hydrolase-like protein